MTEQTIPKVTPNMVDCSKGPRENIVLRDVMQQRNRKHHRDDVVFNLILQSYHVGCDSEITFLVIHVPLSFHVFP